MKKLSLILAVIASAALTACGGGEEAVLDTVQVATPAQLQAEQDAEFAKLTVTPNGHVSTAGSYASPAQMRSRYGFDQLVEPIANQGSGQLIAIIAAYNNPDAAESLAVFSEKFGLPKCRIVNTEYTTPLNSYTQAKISKPAAGENCTFQSINVDSFGRATAKAPNANTGTSSWTIESNMDIQWAHAMAPGASIVLIQAPTNFVGAMAYAAQYASQVAKSDVVSMSWGIAEDSIKCKRKLGYPTIQSDPNCSDEVTSRNYWSLWADKFTGPTQFVSSSGDRRIVQWPANTPTVMSVGGTQNGNVAWNGSGGGVSVMYAAPAQQGFTGKTRRLIPDVAYEAVAPVAIYVKPNPLLGVGDDSCVAANGIANCGWYGGVGTSAGTPQWAGLVAVANAQRLSSGRGRIDYLSALYTDIASIGGRYASSFTDITVGGLTTNPALPGYDTVTGLGVPNAATVVNYLVAK